MWWVIGGVAVLWVTGFIAVLRDTDNSAKTWWGKGLAWLFLFFAWPYIAFVMGRQMG